MAHLTITNIIVLSNESIISNDYRFCQVIAVVIKIPCHMCKEALMTLVKFLDWLILNKNTLGVISINYGQVPRYKNEPWCGRMKITTDGSNLVRTQNVFEPLKELFELTVGHSNSFYKV